MEDEREERGVHNARVVDLISYDDERDEVVLLMVEERPWETAEEQPRHLEDKFNSYLTYVLDGHLSQQYPQYTEKDVCIRLDCATSPRGEVQRMLPSMQNFAESEKIRFVVHVIDS